MVRLSAVGEVHDHGVVEHRAVAFRNGFQPFAELGDLFKVKPANEMIHAGCVHAVLATTVAGVVFALGESEALEANIKIANTRRGGEGQHIGQSGNERGGAEVELRVQPIGFHLAGVFVAGHRRMLA